MVYPKTNASNDSSRYSRSAIILFVVSPSILMICMAVIETYALPLISDRAHMLVNDTKLDMLLSALWVVFISFRLRKQLPGYWFFSWWPILAILCVVAVYGFSAFLGLPIGREERFPAIVVMLPASGILLILSLGSTIYNAICKAVKSE